MGRFVKGEHFNYSTEFKKGHKPWNKGTKGIMKANNGTFKKGNIPWCKGIKNIHLSPNSEWKKGNIPWNKREIPYKYIKKRKEDYLPRGLAGKKMKIEGRIKLSETRKRLFKEGKIQIWNKGITKELDERINKLAKQFKERRNNLIFPKKDTKIEIKIQNFLKQLNIEFFTHQYIKDIEHSYQCDILIPSINLVIECDGNYWHKYPIGTENDRIRTNELINKGFKVLRLWESEIKHMNINSFRNKLKILKNG